MAKIYDRKKVLLAKIEGTEGVDATPMAATDAVRTREFSFDPWEGERLERNLDKGTFGSDTSTQLAKHGVLRFQVEAAGSGDPTVAPAYGGLLRAAGHAQALETVGVEGEDLVRYTPLDTGVPSLTCYFHHDKKLHKFLGSRGLVRFQTGKRNYPYFIFEFRGLYVPVTDGTLPTPDHSAFMKPVKFSKSSVSASLFAETVGLHNFTLNGGQEIDFYETSEEESIQQMDRNANFEMLFEEPEASDHDFWADADGETTGALEVQHGTVGGNIVIARTDTAQLYIDGTSAEGGVRALQTSGPCVPVGSTPDYEFIIK